MATGFIGADTDTRVPKYGLGKNLLANWYFAGGSPFPVNSRGKTSWDTTIDDYAFDSWIWAKVGGYHWGVLTLQNTGARVTRTINGSAIVSPYQDLMAAVTGTVTLSALVRTKATSGRVGIVVFGESLPTIFAGAWDDSTTASETLHLLQVTCTGTVTGVGFNHTSATSADDYIEVVAIKLEMGKEQTLAHEENGTWVLNEFPDLQEERIKSITGKNGYFFAEKTVATGEQLSWNVENGETFSHEYSVGEYFRRGGQLLKVTQAVSIGDTIDDHTNCDQRYLADDLCLRVVITTASVPANTDTDIAIDPPMNPLINTGKAIGILIGIYGYGVTIKSIVSIGSNILYNYPQSIVVNSPTAQDVSVKMLWIGG